MSSTPLVSIGRDSTTARLFDTKGGVVKLYTSLTGNDQSKITAKYEGKESVDDKFAQAIETIIACFIEWNVGKEGVMLPCTQETVKQFTQRDILAMLQACTGKQLLDENGNLLSEEESRKKAVSA